MNTTNKYDDIINLPHHISKKHPQMSIEARSAQFAPFAALVGFDKEIQEVERLTSNRKDIDENLKEILDIKLQIIKEQINTKPLITITYFVTDLKKDGGSYITINGNAERIDEYKNTIILENKIEIPISEIIYIDVDSISFQKILYYK